MNKNIARYRRGLKRKLHCDRKKRRELLVQFTCTLSDFMDEYPDPTYSQLTDAFGPPEEMTCVLMENVTEEENNQYRKQQKLLKTIKITAIVLLAIFAIYAYFYKEYTVIEFYDELAPVQAIVAMGGK